LRCRASGLVRLAAAFAAGQGGQIAEQVAGFEAFGQGVRAAVGGEVEFLAVIDDEQGGAGELLFPEAVLEFLEQRGVGMESIKFVFELIH
jgi:hypothetical protein